MPAVASPRPDQIDLLTRGLDLPLVPLERTHLEIISHSIAFAWADLIANHKTVLDGGDEAEVSALMETRLSNLLDEDIIWDQLVRAVSRGKETISFDGSHLEKRPDLSIHLTSRNPSFPLVVECKIIDHPRRKSKYLYCRDGLFRFLNGEYAWAVSEAFMLAYVRDRSTIASALTPLLGRNIYKNHYSVSHLPVSVNLPNLDVAQSEHLRHFRYIGRSAPKDVPGSIKIWHIWMPT